MTNESNHKEEFVRYMKQLEELQELSKGDSRPTQKDKKEKRLRQLSYEALMEFKDDLNAKGINIPILTPDELKNQKELYETGLKARQTNANERSADMLVKNLDEVLTNVSKGSLEDLVFKKPFVENADEKLVGEYKDVLDLYQSYFRIKELMERYKNGEKLDPEKDEPILYGAIAAAAAERIKKRLKEEGLSEEMQRIGASIAFLAAQNKGIEKKSVLRNADKMIREAEDNLRKYEEDKDKRIVDYVAKNLNKMVRGEDPEKFNIGRNLIYHVAKEPKESEDKEKNKIIKYPAPIEEAAA